MLTLKQLARVEFETWVVNPDGTEEPRSQGHNLILDIGMDMPVLRQWANCMQYCAIGDGTTPTSRDSGPITFSRAGTTVTASAGFFETNDAGRVLKFDTGERVRIASFTDGTNVETVDAGTIAAAQGTVWYVNEIGHQFERQRTNQLSAVPGSNLSSFLVDTWTHQRVYLFPPSPANYLITEIGWSPDGRAPTSGGVLFGRALVPAGGDSLAAGQQYKVRVRLLIKYSNATATNTLSSGSFSMAGTSKTERIRVCQLAGDNSGGVETCIALDGFGNDPKGYAIGEPFLPNIMMALTVATDALAEMGTTGPLIPRMWDQERATGDSYVAGSWQRIFRWGLGVLGSDISGINGIVFWGLDGGMSNYRMLFNSPQTKEADYAVNIAWVMTWDRDMPN